MAKLKRSIIDGHYFILFGKSKGTWQIDQANLPELERLAHISRPQGYGDSRDFYGVSWDYLWSRNLIYKYDIPYDSYYSDDDDKDARSISIFRLPLLLLPQGSLNKSWSLAVDLTAIPENLLAEAREHQVLNLTVSGATQTGSTLLSQIPYVKTVRVRPQAAQYTLSWIGSSQRFSPSVYCSSPSLDLTSLGNVFAEGQDKIWRCYEHGNNAPFWGTLYWLARVGFLPGWPGKAEKWGDAQNGWRLWRLITSAECPVTWRAIDNWLGQRYLSLSRHTQHLHLVTPPLAITEDGWSLASRDQPLIIGCTPPGRVTPGIRSQLQLTVTRVDGGRNIAVDVAPGLQHDAVSDELWFARWMRPQPGDYRILAVGGATVEPLLVRVLSDASVYQTTPIWLQGLACHLTAGDHSETLTAFAESNHPRVTVFSDAELPHLQWDLQPEGLPVWVSWHPDTESADGYSLHSMKFESGDELTRWWRDTIWPDCAAARGVQLIIEGDSFGRIECAIGLPLCDASADKWTPTTKQRAELTWLAQLSLAPSTQLRVPLPADLRLALKRLYTLALQASNATTIAAAVSLLRAQHAIPAWIVPRLRVLVAAEPVRARTLSARTTSFEATLAQ